MYGIVGLVPIIMLYLTENNKKRVEDIIIETDRKEQGRGGEIAERLCAPTNTSISMACITVMQTEVKPSMATRMVVQNRFLFRIAPPKKWMEKIEVVICLRDEAIWSLMMVDSVSTQEKRNDWDWDTAMLGRKQSERHRHTNTWKGI